MRKTLRTAVAVGLFCLTAGLVVWGCSTGVIPRMKHDPLVALGLKDPPPPKVDPITDWGKAHDWARAKRLNVTLRIHQINHISDEIWVYLEDRGVLHDFGMGARRPGQPEDADILDFDYNLGFMLFFMKEPPSDGARIVIKDEGDNEVSFGKVEVLLHR